MAKEELVVEEPVVEEQAVEEQPLSEEELLEQRKKAALTSFILGIVAFVLHFLFGMNLVPLILSAVGLGKGKKAKGELEGSRKVFRLIGKILNIITLILSIIGLVLSIIAVLLIPVVVIIMVAISVVPGILVEAGVIEAALLLL